MHLAARLLRLAQWHGSRPALTDERGTLTYTDFVGRCARLGNAMRGHGLARGDRVAMLVPDVREYLEADYGLMAAGLVRVPLDPRSTEADLIALLNHAGASAAITHASNVARVASIRAKVPSLKTIVVIGATGHADGDIAYEDLMASASDELAVGGSDADLASLNFSGGTTGRPKAIMIPHRVLSAVMQNTIHGFGIDERCIFLNVRPLWPVAQVIVMAYLMAGAHVVLAKRFDADQFADQIAQSGATRSSLVPTQLVRLVEVLSAHDPRFNTLEAVHVGGSQIPPPVFERALELLGPKIGVLYGLTEAPITCYLPPRRFAEEPTRQHELVRSVGRPLLGYEVCVDSDAGPTAQSGVRGEVMVRGANVMDGYWHDEAASTASLQQSWLRTGDIGTFGPSGDLAIVGRLKEVIRTGATSVDPREVEETIGALPGVAEVAVVGVPDEEWGEAVTAFVAPAAGATLSVDVIIEHCRANLAGYKKPRAVHVVASLPRSHYGKVLRAELIASVSARKGD